jgi:predicted nucleotidyltransferase
MKTNQLPRKKSFPFNLKRFWGEQKKYFRISNIENHSDLDDRAKRSVSIANIANCEIELINNLFSDIKKYEEYVSVYLHGSWADDTRISFSDIDDFVVLDLDKLIKNKKIDQVLRILNRIDMKFCRLDPIQHHGHWIVSENELNDYDDSFMPLHILSDAKKIIGNNYIEASVNRKDSIIGLKKNIKNTCRGIERLSNLYFTGNINCYQLKALIGSFVLMPAFVYQITGERLTKPEAINKASKIYSKNALNCILWSTACREKWSVITDTKKFKLFSAMPLLFFNPHIWRRFSEKFAPVVSQVQKDNLAEQELDADTVKIFLQESLDYAK